MRKIILAIAALAIVGFASPVVSAANAETIVVKKGHDHHYRHHHDRKVVIIKHRRHRDHDHD